jgi:hypothetical protein
MKVAAPVQATGSWSFERLAIDAQIRIIARVAVNPSPLIADSFEGATAVLPTGSRAVATIAILTYVGVVAVHTFNPLSFLS